MEGPQKRQTEWTYEVGTYLWFWNVKHREE